MPDPTPAALPAPAATPDVVRAVMAEIAAARAVGSDGKPAYRSTEFWLSVGFKAVCVAVMGYGVAKGNDDLVKLALECAGGNVVLYTFARTMAKRAAPAAPGAPSA